LGTPSFDSLKNLLASVLLVSEYKTARSKIMLTKIGNKNFTLLGKMLDLHSAKHKVSAQNIANVNTPNYRRREFKFSKALREAMAKGQASDYRNIRGFVDRPTNTAVRNNGNNVDIDMEMASMQENAMFYQIYTDLYTKKVKMLNTAIKGGS
jgi:flagellar basal-body rod protein FlgB